MPNAECRMPIADTGPGDKQTSGKAQQLDRDRRTNGQHTGGDEPPDSMLDIP